MAAQYQRLVAANQDLIAANQQLRALLRRIEWGRWDSECPACGGGSDGGDNHHEDGCELAAELRQQV